MSRTDQRAIRLMIVDDHALFRESLARLLQAEPGFEVVAHCGSAAEAQHLLSAPEAIDIVLLDLDLGQGRGTEFLDTLRKKGFAGKVLLVTAGVSDSEIAGLIRKGIASIFMKHGSPASLIQGIRDAMEGKAQFAQSLLLRALEIVDTPAPAQIRPSITERERQVLFFVFEGLANKQIADRLQISETAVKASLQQLFGKTGVRTRSQLVRIALEQYRDQL
jgi:two-component system, NarL family, nitrate/nitrite response regulator NarL